MNLNKKKMANKELSLRQQLDALAAEGKEIKVTWEGGNDSGGYSLFIGGVEVNYGDAGYDEIVDFISDVIDYGSWAGDYSADGSVIYDSDEGAFVGEGQETESEAGTIDEIAIEVRVPKVLNFDSVEIHTEGTFCWGELDVTCRLTIYNGPVFQEHAEAQETLRDSIRESVIDILETNPDCKNEEIGYVYNEWSIRRDLFKEDGDDLVYILDEMDFTYNNTKHQSHHIPITDEQ